MKRRDLVVAGMASVPLLLGGCNRSPREKSNKTMLIKQPANPVFAPYYDMGGVLYFEVFSSKTAGEAGYRDAIGMTLAQMSPVDDKALRELPGRRITEQALMGDWYDPNSGDLIRKGIHKTRDGRELTDPRLRSLAGVEIVSGGSPLGNGLAYAFQFTPYGLSGGPLEVQKAFDAIRAFILPSGQESRIYDWSHARLDTLSPYFKAGLEWWGVFLYTVHIPATGQMTVITGSATD